MDGSSVLLKFYCPNKECDHYNSAMVDPLIEQIDQHCCLNIKCPSCFIGLFACENCLALIKDEYSMIEQDSKSQRLSSPSEFNIRSYGTGCTKCGFFNLIDPVCRSMLSLDTILPVSVKNIRNIQRSISEMKYIVYKQNQISFITALLVAQKSNLDENYATNVPGKRKRNEIAIFTPKKKRKISIHGHYQEMPNGYKEISILADDELYKDVKQMLSAQMDMLEDYEIREEDQKYINEFSFSERVKCFTADHLRMLKALYSEKDNLETTEIFEKVSYFLTLQWEILKVKVENENSAKVKNVVDGITAQHRKKPAQEIDSNNIIASILHYKYKRLQNILEISTSPYLSLLVFSSREIKSLLQTLIEEQRKVTKQKLLTKSNTGIIGFYDNSTFLKKRLLMEQRIECVKNKIHLWRSLYHTVSSCVL